ncbi:MAG: DNA repair protein RecO [Eggerthellaceae bacterium]|nr:DNA repair protein RecO [Eggerthellaceae bacterium]
MAQAKTYKTSAIVLRKTKLGERDLIVTLLGESGALLKCVAKGARKPGSSFAAKLELFSCVEVMCARGRNLDVITDARFVEGGRFGTFGLEQTACASCVAELLSQICQEDLEHPRLFDMTYAAFGAIASSDPLHALLLADAALLKIISSAGFKPSFDLCPVCGSANELETSQNALAFVVDEGGVVCNRCLSNVEGLGIPTSPIALSWAKALLYTKFSDICALDVDIALAFDVLEIAKPWIEFYSGKRMKSIDYLLSSGLL